MKKIQLAFSGTESMGASGSRHGRGLHLLRTCCLGRSSTELSSEKEQMGGLEVSENATCKLLRVLGF